MTPLVAAAAGVASRAATQPAWREILTSDFMRNAFVGGTIVAVLSGLVGYFVILRRDAFATHALAHIGFPGATGAVLVGAPVTLGLAVFCLAGALVIAALGTRVEHREVATGTVLAMASALGVWFASMATEGASTITTVLFGNLLAISGDQIVVFGCFTVVALGVLALIARPLLFASVNQDVAAARGVPTGALGVVFLVLLALTVTLAVQVVGTLLLFALIVAPAATALSLTARPGVAAAISAAVSVGCVWLGLTGAALFNLPPSFPIVSVAFLTWLATNRRSRR